MGYDHISTSEVGDTSAGCAPTVYVMKADSADASDREDCAAAMDTMLDDVWSAGRIQGYTIHQYNIFYTFDCSGSIIKQLESWRESNLFTDPGAYVAVHTCDKSGAQDGMNAWKDPSDCHGSAHPNRNLERASVHEVQHAYANGSCMYVDEMMANGDEHTLGNAIDVNGNMKYSPFAGPKNADQGTCHVDNPDSSWGQTLHPADCTEDAFKYSANHYLNDHQRNDCS